MRPDEEQKEKEKENEVEEYWVMILLEEEPLGLSCWARMKKKRRRMKKC
jgi:hypothetical protein